jgi:hypothetical protein
MMVLFFLTQFIIIIQQQSSFFILIKRSLLAADHFYAEKSIKCSMILALELTLLYGDLLMAVLFLIFICGT